MFDSPWLNPGWLTSRDCIAKARTIQTGVAGFVASGEQMRFTVRYALPRAGLGLLKARPAQHPPLCCRLKPLTALGTAFRIAGRRVPVCSGRIPIILALPFFRRVAFVAPSALRSRPGLHRDHGPAKFAGPHAGGSRRQRLGRSSPFGGRRDPGFRLASITG